MPDNGIKFLARGGVKLDDAIEDAIEERLARGLGPPDRRRASAGSRPYDAAVDEYAAHLARHRRPARSTGLKVVLDCADGAASDAGPRALRDAGAEVIAIHAEPDGLNINDGCGSTHLGAAAARPSLEHGADVGFALDGDADRCLAVDHDGQRRRRRPDPRDPRARRCASAGRLADDTVVATVMSNLGFVQAMRAAGVGVRQTKVGDRYVLEAMKVSGYTLGGEQSGHVIMSDHATTGDGILTALHVLRADGRHRAESLADLAAVMTRLPQVLVNVPDVDKARADEDAVLAAAVAEAEAELGDAGRVLLRPSGTEPLVRVMVEAGTADAGASAVADRLADVVRTPAVALS